MKFEHNLLYIYIFFYHNYDIKFSIIFNHYLLMHLIF